MSATKTASAKQELTLGGLITDMASFIREWIRNPRSVAAVAPSGRALASLITSEISASTGPVIELGSGTGSFTRALLRRGVREIDLTLIEYGSDFVRLLQNRFPNSRVLWMDAGWLSRVSLFDGAPVGAVVCGLGLLNIKEEKIAEIIRGAFRFIRPDGAFYLFTYGPRCSVPQDILDELNLEARHVGRTIKNIPPASVYKLSRRGSTAT